MGQSLPQVSPPTDAFERRARGEDEEKATEAEDEDEDAVESVVSQRNGKYSATSNCCLRPRSPSHRSTSCSNCHIPSQSSSSANHPCANLRLISLVVSPWATPSTGRLNGTTPDGLPLPLPLPRPMPVESNENCASRCVWLGG